MSAGNSGEPPASVASGLALEDPLTLGEQSVDFLKRRRSSLLGAVFLMAMSAVGPGFITQTATFTIKLGASFGFGILLSIIIDFIVQMNVWRIVGASGSSAGDLANKAVPGSGHLLAALVIFGGLVFSIGNIAGIGLGLNAALGLDPKLGGLIGTCLAVLIFVYRRANRAMDRSVIGLAIVKVAIVLLVIVVVHPPVVQALHRTIIPDQLNLAALTTIVGGTVGGYITYAGAHRLLDAGVTGPQNMQAVSSTALWGVLVTGAIRYLLFLAILGVAASGVTIDLASQTANPAAQAFRYALGEWGFRIFGIIFWAAGTTSTIGAAYTSMSFLGVFHPSLVTGRRRNYATILFIAIALAGYLIVGTAPAALLVFAGGFNGLILPIGLTIMIYVGVFRTDLLGGFRLPRWLLALGALACILMWYMGISSVRPIFALLGIH